MFTWRPISNLIFCIDQSNPILIHVKEPYNFECRNELLPVLRQTIVKVLVPKRCMHLFLLVPINLQETILISRPFRRPVEWPFKALENSISPFGRGCGQLVSVLATLWPRKRSMGYKSTQQPIMFFLKCLRLCTLFIPLIKLVRKSFKAIWPTLKAATVAFQRCKYFLFNSGSVGVITIFMTYGHNWIWGAGCKYNFFLGTK